MTITAEKRKSLSKGEFALPGARKYPIDTAARTRNAAARLEQNKSGLSASEYASAKARIASAAKKFGINSEYNKKSSKRRRGRGLHMKIGSDGSMSIRHMADDDKCIAILPGVEVSKEQDPVTMSDANKPVWNKLAVHGVFKGHPTGPFEMNSDIFSQIEKNFKRDGIDVPFDYEHAAEMPVSESTAKARGEAVASGWIKDVQSRPDGLYGLVEWTDQARQKIKSGEMKYISPAIRFGAKDGKTGEVVGAKLSSAALTLRPFLKELPPALASDSEYTAFLCSEISQEDIRSLDDSSGYALHHNEYLPRFRSMLNMDDMSSPDSMLEKVERLRELCTLAGGDSNATVQGVNLGNYIPKLREFMRMPADTTLDNMLNAIGNMIYAVIEHEASEMEEELEESEGVEMSDMVSVATQKPDDAPAPVIIPKENEKIMDTITLSEHNTKLEAAVAAAVANATSPLTLQLKDVEAKLTAALADKAAADAVVVQLNEQIKTRDAAVAAARVDEAFSTYKEVKKLSDDDKEAMAITLSTKPELFEKLYPKVTPDKAILLRTVTASDAAPAAKAGSVKVIPDLSKILEDVKAKNPGLDYDKQFDMALKEQATLMAG